MSQRGVAAILSAACFVFLGVRAVSDDSSIPSAHNSEMDENTRTLLLANEHFLARREANEEEFTMGQKRSIAILLLVVAGSWGCVTKNYVRHQVTPIINKTNELDDLTARNTKAMKETDQRAQEGIQQAQASAEAADQKAQTAAQHAQRAQTQADSAATRIDTLRRAVATIDDYHVIKEVTVQFGTDKSDLSDEAKTAIQGLASSSRGMKNNLLVIEGFTDSTGNAEHNYALSSRRATAVRQYLSSQYNVPAYKIHVIGLGEDKPLASNRTRDGRAQNRRALVQLMSNGAEVTTSSAVTR